MNVISRRKLRQFYQSKPEYGKHAGAFDAWFKLTRKASWQDFQDAKALFGQTDVARTSSKRTATIFDIGGNKYRIITLIDYARQTVLITHVLTHAEYDRNNWKKGITMPIVAHNPRLKGYLKLIDRFPLKPIENDREHETAVRMITELIGSDLDKGEGNYLSALIALVNIYEDENHCVDADMTPREALKAIMEFNELSQADIGRIIGSESAVSMFLKGQRELSRKQIKALVERFKVDAGLFL